jgi:hypothetical protein
MYLFHTLISASCKFEGFEARKAACDVTVPVVDDEAVCGCVDGIGESRAAARFGAIAISKSSQVQYLDSWLY